MPAFLGIKQDLFSDLIYFWISDIPFIVHLAFNTYTVDTKLPETKGIFRKRNKMNTEPQEKQRRLGTSFVIMYTFQKPIYLVLSGTPRFLP